MPYRAKAVEAYQVRADGMCPQWLIEYINAGTVYWSGGSAPYYTVVIGAGLEARAGVGDWIVYTDPLSVLRAADFTRLYEETV